MNTQSLQSQIEQLNREISARRQSVESLQKQLTAEKTADLERIKKGVCYKVVKVETAQRSKIAALGGIRLVLEGDSATLDAELLKHYETYGTYDNEQVPKRKIQSLDYYYAGGRIWHDGSGYWVIEKESNDSWGDKGVLASLEEWEEMKSGKIPERLRQKTLNIQ